MQASDLRPARDFARNFGVKCIAYGDPGSGKTPVASTCPNPVMLACEPGLRSMATSNVPTWEGYTAQRVDEFFRWFFTSTEVKKFDTLVVDSISQMAEIYLQESIKTKKHGLQAYGEMAKNVMDHLRPLYFTQHKNTYLIAKQQLIEDNGVKLRRPYFPGNQLNVDIPHMYDAILHLGLHNVPSVGKVKAFRCHESMEILARDRSGALTEFEQPNMADIFKKCMA